MQKGVTQEGRSSAASWLEGRCSSAQLATNTVVHPTPAGHDRASATIVQHMPPDHSRPTT